MSKLAFLGISVAVSSGYFARSLIRFPMAEYSIVLVLITSILAMALVVLIYLRRELSRQQKRHNQRRAEYMGSQKVQDLSTDQQAVYQRRVMKSLDMADRKRLMFQVVQNTLLVMAGLLPLMSTMVEDNKTQKLLSFGASFAAFVVGLFSMEKFTTEHRRTGFLIEKALNEWLVGNGTFYGMGANEAFRQLVTEVQVILDTSETSFVGAGSTNARPIVEAAGDVTVNMEQPSDEWITAGSTSTATEIGVSGASAEVVRESAPKSRISDVSAPESSTSFAGVKPEDFGAWQAAALAEDNAEITQQGFSS